MRFDFMSDIENKISVIITCYNDSKVFERCIKSVLEQSIRPLEVIVVDDCSEDSATILSIISKYQVLLNIHYLRNDENMNGAYSRNLGMRKSKGEYLALLDGDDMWLNYHLEKSAALAYESNADFIYSNVLTYDGFVYEKRLVNNLALLDNAADIITISPPQTGSFFFKRKIINSICFDEKLKRHQDYQFFLDAILFKLKISYLDEYLTVYNIGGGDLNKKYDFYSICNFWNRYSNVFSRNAMDKKMYYLYFLIVRYSPSELRFFIQSNSCFSVIKEDYRFKMLQLLPPKRYQKINILLYIVFVGYRQIPKKLKKFFYKLLHRGAF
jgi:glycosyltransferase involved in cell wall biosynthesis